MTTLTGLDIAELRDPVEEYCGILARRFNFDDDRAQALVYASRKIRKHGGSRAFTCSSIRRVAQELAKTPALSLLTTGAINDQH